MSQVVMALLVLAGSAGVFAQTVIDRIAARVNGEVLTLSEIRAVRALKLVPDAPESDAALCGALVDRRLLLAEVTRYPPSEPSTDAVAAHRQEWERRLGPDADVPGLLAQVGETAGWLDAWLIDDLQIRAFLERRFAGAGVPTRDDLLRYYRDHQADFTVGGVVQPFERVEADVRAGLTASRRTAEIDRWLESLRRRANLIVLIK